LQSDQEASLGSERGEEGRMLFMPGKQWLVVLQQRDDKFNHPSRVG
jgi:hypothetical protein